MQGIRQHISDRIAILERHAESKDWKGHDDLRRFFAIARADELKLLLERMD